MKKTDLAYAAGLLDGEGCFTVRYVPARYGKNRGNHGILVCVHIKQEHIVKWLKSQWGGNTYQEFRENRQATHCNLWRWNITNRKAERFLRATIPYLKIKQRQAKILLRLQNRMLKPTARRGGVSQKEFDFRESLKAQIHKLNRTGPN